MLTLRLARLAHGSCWRSSSSSVIAATCSMTGSYCALLIMSASYGLTDMGVHQLFCPIIYVYIRHLYLT